MSNLEGAGDAGLLAERDAHGAEDVTDSAPEASVCAIVITYNSERWLESCLRGIHAQRGARVTLVVVDNGSTDTTLATMGELEARGAARLVRQGHNSGYAAACNAGLRLAIAEGFDYALILNPDVEMLPGALAEMIAIDRSKPGMGPLSPVHISRDAPLIEGTCRWYLGLNEQFPADYARRGPFPRVYQTPYISGAIMLFERRLMERLGMFDELFFFYGEDNDICRRYTLAQRLPAVAVRAHAYHWHASARIMDPMRRSNLRRANYQMIFKKPSRPYGVNCLGVIAKVALDLAIALGSPREMPAIIGDFLNAAAKRKALRLSRAQDIQRAASLRQSSV